MNRFAGAVPRLSNLNLSFGGGNGSFRQRDFWDVDALPFAIGGTPAEREQLEHDFGTYVSQIVKRDGIVFACLLVRQNVFSQARFQWQRIRDGRPGQYFGTPGLSLLERPFQGGTTGELLARMEQDASIAGNWFGTVRGSGADARIRRLRPDWVTIVTGSPSDDPFDIDAEVVGYLYEPKGNRANRTEPKLLTADQVAHWSPIPDPEAQWRGMSWITPVIREIQSDLAATEHKLNYFKNGTTANLAVTYPDSMDIEKVKAYAEVLNSKHDGVHNAYKTLHIGGGADVTSVGADMRQVDFKATQGAGETRIAAAAGLGAVMAQLSEGLSGSSLNAGNFDAARKRAETTLFRPLWDSAAATLEQLIPAPSLTNGDGFRLAPDLRDVAFVRADSKAEAEIHQMHAATMRQLIEAGFEPDSVRDAIESGDLSQLQHSGLVSVQLQPAGAEPPAPNPGN